jgi:hypothetical protein
VKQINIVSAAFSQQFFFAVEAWDLTNHLGFLLFLGWSQVSLKKEGFKIDLL